IDEGRPDLALLDMRLPGMDGIQILQKIHEKEADLPIIMVTGYGNVELAEQALKLGAEHYLSKPFHNKELLSVIKQILEKRGIEVPDAPAPAVKNSPANLYPEETAAEGRSFSKSVLAIMGAAIIFAGWYFVRPKRNYAVPYANPAALVFMDNN